MPTSIVMNDTTTGTGDSNITTTTTVVTSGGGGSGSVTTTPTTTTTTMKPPPPPPLDQEIDETPLLVPNDDCTTTATSAVVATSTTTTTINNNNNNNNNDRSSTTENHHHQYQHNNNNRLMFRCSDTTVDDTNNSHNNNNNNNTATTNTNTAAVAAAMIVFGTPIPQQQQPLSPPPLSPPPQHTLPTHVVVDAAAVRESQLRPLPSSSSSSSSSQPPPSQQYNTTVTNTSSIRNSNIHNNNNNNNHSMNTNTSSNTTNTSNHNNHDVIQMNATTPLQMLNSSSTTTTTTTTNNNNSAAVTATGTASVHRSQLQQQQQQQQQQQPSQRHTTNNSSSSSFHSVSNNNNNNNNSIDGGLYHPNYPNQPQHYQQPQQYQVSQQQQQPYHQPPAPPQLFPTVPLVTAAVAAGTEAATAADRIRHQQELLQHNANYLLYQQQQQSVVAVSFPQLQHPQQQPMMMMMNMPPQQQQLLYQPPHPHYHHYQQHANSNPLLPPQPQQQQPPQPLVVPPPPPFGNHHLGVAPVVVDSATKIPWHGWDDPPRSPLQSKSKQPTPATTTIINNNTTNQYSQSTTTCGMESDDHRRHETTTTTTTTTKNNTATATATHPYSMFGLPPIPESIHNFAALPLPHPPPQIRPDDTDTSNNNNHTSGTSETTATSDFPSIEVLEGDLTIYEYIALRARTIADHLDASVQQIRTALDSMIVLRQRTLMMEEAKEGSAQRQQQYDGSKQTPNGGTTNRNHHDSSHRHSSHQNDDSNNNNDPNMNRYHHQRQSTTTTTGAAADRRTTLTQQHHPQPHQEEVAAVAVRKSWPRDKPRQQQQQRRPSPPAAQRHTTAAASSSVITDAPSPGSIVQHDTSDYNNGGGGGNKGVISAATNKRHNNNDTNTHRRKDPRQKLLQRKVSGDPSASKAVARGETNIIAKELESIKEEARILAQYAEFSRRVLEKKTAAEMTNASGQKLGCTTTASSLTTNNRETVDNGIGHTNTNNNNNNNNNTPTDTETLQKINGQIQAVKNAEIEAREKELEKIKEQARRIASRTRKIIIEGVPEGLLTATSRPHPKITNAATGDDLDVSSISDPAMLLESVRQSPNNQGTGDATTVVIPTTNTNEIEAIRDEARRIAQYTYQIIAGIGIGGSSSRSDNTSIVADTAAATPTFSAQNNNRVVVPPTASPVVDEKDSGITDDEARIRTQYSEYEQYSQRLNDTKKLSIGGCATTSASAVTIDNDNCQDLSTDPHIVNSDTKTAAIDDAPFERRNSIGQLISKERAREIERIKEEARLLAMHVGRPNKGTKRASSNSTLMYETKQPEFDYVINPDAERSLPDASTLTTEFVTWTEILGESEWVSPDDVGVVADSVLIGLAQFKPCRSHDDDIYGRYSHIEIGYTGLCCKHCFGQPGYGRYFPTTLSSFTTSFPSTVVKHILDDCTSCPKWIKDTVYEVECVHQRSNPRISAHSGSKALMQFVWDSIRNAIPEEIDEVEEVKRRNILRSPVRGLISEVTWEELLGYTDLVFIDDETLVSNALLAVWGQYEKCQSDECDVHRMNKSKPQTIGVSGYCCRHCKRSPYTLGSRLFPINLLALQTTDTTERMTQHVTTDCPSCPGHVRNAIIELESNDPPVLPRHGGWKIFFRRLWKRLHIGDDPYVDGDCAVESTNTATELDSPNEPDSADIQIVQELIQDNVMVSMIDQGLVHNSILVAYGQLKPCRLEAMDKAGWYKDREIGFPGVCCKHCNGRPSSGRYFPKTGDNFLRSSKHSIVRHLTELCKHCPDNIRVTIQRLQQKEAKKSDCSTADDLILGAGRSFHHNLWLRLYKHYNVPHGYYEAIDYSYKSGRRASPVAGAALPNAEKTTNNHSTVLVVDTAATGSSTTTTTMSTSPQYVKKRKVDYGRSNPHRKNE